ncbi:hypothetical protein HDU76_010776, partial [Blyttiomyces sp. JEL0837]
GTTDTHGWQKGHGSNYDGQFSANWADFAVFVDGMRALAAKKDVELFVVDSGDTHDGTALSDNTGALVDGIYTQPMMQKVDYDVLAVGNHELYVGKVASSVHDNFAPFWGDKYLSSNTYINVNNAWTPIGQKYRVFTGTKGTKVLGFGFLFKGFKGDVSTNVTDPSVEVQQQWFKDAINNNPHDLILLCKCWRFLVEE